jgi:hypothetical protein
MATDLVEMFDRFVSGADVFAPSSDNLPMAMMTTRAAEGSRPRRAPARKSPTAVVDSLAKALDGDVQKGEKVLTDLETMAISKPQQALIRLADFGEVLKRVAKRTGGISDKFSGIVEKFHSVAKAIATAFKAESFSISINLPWRITVGFTFPVSGK